MVNILPPNLSMRTLGDLVGMVVKFNRVHEHSDLRSIGTDDVTVLLGFVAGIELDRVFATVVTGEVIDEVLREDDEVIDLLLGVGVRRIRVIEVPKDLSELRRSKLHDNSGRPSTPFILTFFFLHRWYTKRI